MLRKLVAQRTGLRPQHFAVLAFVILALTVSEVRAQSNDLQTLIQRVDRLQREMVTLQRQVYSGETPPPSEAGLAATGSNPGGGDVAPNIAARLQTRIDELEAQLRNLTGQVEETNFQVTQLTSRFDKLVGDVDFRLRELEARVGGGGLAGSPPLASSSDAAPSEALSQGAEVGSAEPGVLGSVPQQEVDALRAEQAEPSAIASPPASTQTAVAALPGGSVQADYDYAFGLLRQANYVEAEQALKSFLDEHPDDALAGNAKYWLGETFYVRGDYRQAAVTFAEGFQRYPDSSKAADNLLKLGMSLAQLQKTEDACGAFGELLKRYPNAAANIQQRATRERERLGCS